MATAPPGASCARSPRPVTAAILCTLLPLSFAACAPAALITGSSCAPDAMPSLAPAATAPPARDYGGLSQGPVTQVVLFGGQPAGVAGALNDTWIWDQGSWHEARPEHVPPPQEAPRLALDPSHDVVVMFGDSGGANPGSVTWTWDGSDWRQQSPAVSPPYHPFTSLAWDAGDNLVLLFGGGDGRTGLLDDTWGWDGSNWHLMHPAHSPPPQVGAAMSDDGRGDVLLFSAENPPQISSAPTWVWHDDDWLPVMPHAGPQQSQPLRRADAALAYDPELSAPVLLGGHLTVPGCDAAGAWAWRGSWASLTPAGLPPRMVDAGAASLPGGGVMLFGGSPGDTVQPTSWTWVLRGTQWTRVT